MLGRCQLCEIDEMALTGHHIIPRMRHNKRVKRDLGRDRNDTVDLCNPCHGHIHALFTEKELEREYFTIEKLKGHVAVQRWIEWKRKRPNLGKI